MRDRLIELLRKSGASFENALPEEIADYLLANGVIVPSCKVGDKVYFLDAICVNDGYCIHNCLCIECTLAELQVVEIDFDLSMYNEIGKTVFLTKEEAEKALAERSEGNA